MIWVGTILSSKTKTENQNALGFSLIFANMPFARILTASMGSGDEVWGLNLLLKNYNLAWTIGLIFVLTVSFFPLFKAFKIIENKRRIGWFLLFFLAPTFIDLLLVLGVMNTLLDKGLLNDYWILGSPMLVTVWTAIVTLTYFLTRKNIYELTEK